jgi:hypothetical protein
LRGEICDPTGLRPCELKKRLFAAYGPLSSFAAKIDLAFALEITTEATHKELHKMRKIRNAFAHTKKVSAWAPNRLRQSFTRWLVPLALPGIT